MLHFFFFLFLSLLNISYTFAQTLPDSISAVDCGDDEYNPAFEEEVSFNPVTFQNPIYIQLYDVAKKQFWCPPLLNTTLKTSNFGVRWGKFHHGIDLGLRTGAPVFSVFDGIVKLSAYYGGYGNCVIIKHYNGLETLYGHLSRLKVRNGQKIKAGQQIGAGGSTGYSTGPHLHFEVRYKGYSINPLLLYDFNQKNQIRSFEFVLKPHHFRHFGNKTPKKNYLYHEVGNQETLESISKQYGVSVEKIAFLNRLSNEKIEKGQILRIK